MTFIRNINPIALRRAKIVYNSGLSECNRVMTIICNINPIALRNINRVNITYDGHNPIALRKAKFVNNFDFLSAIGLNVFRTN